MGRSRQFLRPPDYAQVNGTIRNGAAGRQPESFSCARHIRRYGAVRSHVIARVSAELLFADPLEANAAVPEEHFAWAHAVQVVQSERDVLA